MKKLNLLLAAALVWTLPSCSDSDGQPNGEESGENAAAVVFTDADIALAANTLDFNYGFVTEGLKAAPGENITVSPLSATILLGMLANGADAELAAEIASALGSDDTEGVNALCAKYLAVLPACDEAATVELCNGLWYKSTLKLNGALAEKFTETYDAEIAACDFAGNSQAAVKLINDWVSKSTHGLIGNIIDRVDPDAVAVTANALYFKGLWAEPFDKKDSAKGVFHGEDGDSEVWYMHSDGLQHYCAGEGYQAVKMQIGKGDYEAVFILPVQGIEPDATMLAEVCAARSSDEPLQLSLLRFKSYNSEEIALNGLLGNLGIRSLGKTLPSGLFDSAVAVSHKLFQKAGCEFDEEGAEGAAVTWAESETSSGPDEESEPFVLDFNRPFVYMINSTATGATLLAGRIVKL